MQSRIAASLNLFRAPSPFAENSRSTSISISFVVPCLLTVGFFHTVCPCSLVDCAATGTLSHARINLGRISAGMNDILVISLQAISHNIIISIIEVLWLTSPQRLRTRAPLLLSPLSLFRITSRNRINVRIPCGRLGKQ